MKFAIVLVLMLIEAQAEKQSFCGSRLIDQLQYICGKRGIRSMKSYHLGLKYPGLKTGNSRRRRSVEEIIARLIRVDEGQSFVEAVLGEPESVSPFHSMIKVGDEMRKDRTQKRKFRRGITMECCRNECSLIKVKQKYCGGRFRHYS